MHKLSGKELLNLALEKKAILFDMDGTIINTEPLHAKAGFQLLKKHNIDIDFHDFEKKCLGVADYIMFSRFFPSCNTSDINDLVQKKNRILLDLLHSYTSTDFFKLLTLGIHNFLTLLKQHGKFLAVVSASEDDIVYETIKKSNLTPFFDLLISTKNSFLSKPSSSQYFTAMRYFKVSSSDVLIFEDSPTGLQSAKESGAMVVKMIISPNAKNLSDNGTLANVKVHSANFCC